MHILKIKLNFHNIILLIYIIIKMNELTNISNDDIRKNWNIHKTNIASTSLQYKSLWDSMEIKLNIDTTDAMYIILKNFTNNEKISVKKPINNSTQIVQEPHFIIIKGLDSYHRRIIHLLCDKIGLHHDSKCRPKNKKWLFIYRPINWSCEYTEKNPYSESDEYYKQRAIEWKDKVQQRGHKSKKKYCRECDRDGLEVELFHSIYMAGLYCEECLEITSDGEGCNLNDHKFEPI